MEFKQVKHEFVVAFGHGTPRGESARNRISLSDSFLVGKWVDGQEKKTLGNGFPAGHFSRPEAAFQAFSAQDGAASLRAHLCLPKGTI